MKLTKWNTYFLVAILITTILCIIQQSSLLLSISSISGVIYSLLVAKNNKYAFLFGMVNVGNYGYLLFTEGIYGGFIYNSLYSLPMLMWGFVKWGKVSKQKDGGVKKLSTKSKLIGSLLVFIVICIVGYILHKMGGQNYVLDSVSTVLGYVGIYLMTNKYIEQWDVWVICNIANLILWVSLTIVNITNLPVVIMWGIYTINSGYGYITWNKKYSK